MSDESSHYNYDQNYLLGLSYLEAFIEEDDERANLIESQIPEAMFPASGIQVNIALLNRLCELEGKSGVEVLKAMRDEYLLKP